MKNSSQNQPVGASVPAIPDAECRVRTGELLSRSAGTGVSRAGQGEARGALGSGGSAPTATAAPPGIGGP